MIQLSERLKDCNLEASKDTVTQCVTCRRYVAIIIFNGSQVATTAQTRLKDHERLTVTSEQGVGCGSDKVHRRSRIVVSERLRHSKAPK